LEYRPRLNYCRLAASLEVLLGIRMMVVVRSLHVFAVNRHGRGRIIFGMSFISVATSEEADTAKGEKGKNQVFHKQGAAAIVPHFQNNC
jgi:hypothetical protein